MDLCLIEENDALLIVALALLFRNGDTVPLLYREILLPAPGFELAVIRVLTIQSSE